MLQVLSSVVLVSLSGVMLPGPMFAVTVAKSYRSPWAGALISLGHAVIEVPLILLIYFGFARFFENVALQVVLSMLGGGMIIWMGVSMFRARAEVVHGGKDLPYGAFTAGVITSALNPAFLLWWATVGSMLITRVLEHGALGPVLLTTVHWLCDLAWLSLISVLIYRTKSLWGRQVHKWLFTGCSLLLLYFGGWFIVSGIQKVV